MQMTCYSGLEKSSIGFQQCPDYYRTAGPLNWPTRLTLILDLSDHAPRKAHFLFLQPQALGWLVFSTLAGRERGSTGLPDHSHPPWRAGSRGSKLGAWPQEGRIVFRKLGQMLQKKEREEGRGGEGKRGEGRMSPSRQWWLQPGVPGKTQALEDPACHQVFPVLPEGNHQAADSPFPHRRDWGRRSFWSRELRGRDELGLRLVTVWVLLNGPCDLNSPE